MITYGISIQGKSHVRKNIVCQDFNGIVELGDGWYVVAVADGVGSAKHSEIGSSTAVTSLLNYCQQHFVVSRELGSYVQMLQEAYKEAYAAVVEVCANKNGHIEDYDTTLSVALYNGTRVIYGHAGDGGIVVRCVNGTYEMITSPQKGIDGISVRPLRAGEESWEFGICDKKVVSVLLATDGMLDTLLPSLLNVQSVELFQQVDNKNYNVYTTLAEYFANPYCIYLNDRIRDKDKFLADSLKGKIPIESFNICIRNGYVHTLGEIAADAIIRTIEQYNYPTWKLDKVDDDKTIACAMNEDAELTSLDANYYAEPDWKALQNQFERLAYPSMFDGDDSENDEPIVQKLSLIFEKQTDVVKQETKIQSKSIYCPPEISAQKSFEQDNDNYRQTEEKRYSKIAPEKNRYKNIGNRIKFLFGTISVFAIIAFIVLGVYLFRKKQNIKYDMKPSEIITEDVEKEIEKQEEKEDKVLENKESNTKPETNKEDALNSSQKKDGQSSGTGTDPERGGTTRPIRDKVTNKHNTSSSKQLNEYEQSFEKEDETGVTGSKQSSTRNIPDSKMQDQLNNIHSSPRTDEEKNHSN